MQRKSRGVHSRSRSISSPAARKRTKPKVDSRATYQQVWSSRGFVMLLCVVVIFMSISVTKEVIRRIQIEREIAAVESEIAKLESRNKEMSNVIALLGTSTNQEKQARVKLNTQKEGEQVIIVPNSGEDREIVLPDGNSLDDIPTQSDKSNPEKWFDYFINKLDS